MIKNENQLKITRSRLRDFERSLKICEEGQHPDEVIRKATVDGIRSQIEDLRKDIRGYERLNA